MAYVLGFIAADGSLIKNKRGACFLEIQSIDKEIICKIKKALRTNLAVGLYQPKNKNYSKRYRLQVGSKEIFKDLLNLGIGPRKSKTIKLPILSNKYFSHFLRGYFDGDGCVNICTYQRKNRKNLSTILSSEFASGSKDILIEIKNRLQEMNIIKGGSFFYNQGYRLSFSINDSLRLYEFMYSDLDNDLYLSRKKCIFEEYLKRKN